MDSETMEAAGKLMQDSWINVPEGKEKSREEGGTGVSEGRLTHSRSQQEMEQLLASAASDDEDTEENPISVPSFTVPEQHVEQGMQQMSSTAEAVGEGLRHASSAASEELNSGSGILGLRGLSWLFDGGVAKLLVPVLVLTHLALFGLGVYIGRRTNLVKTL